MKNSLLKSLNLKHGDGIGASEHLISLNEKATEYLSKSLGRYEENTFAQYLERNFGETATIKMLEDYNIGTSNKYEGAAIFWRTDREGKVCEGLIVLFNPYTGGIIKIYDSIIAKVLDIQAKPCFYGEHLLEKEPNKTVAIADNKAIAVIGSHLYPDYLWLSGEGTKRTLYDRRIRWVELPDTNFDKLNKFKKVYKH